MAYKLSAYNCCCGCSWYLNCLSEEKVIPFVTNITEIIYKKQSPAFVNQLFLIIKILFVVSALTNFKTSFIVAPPPNQLHPTHHPFLCMFFPSSGNSYVLLICYANDNIFTGSSPILTSDSIRNLPTTFWHKWWHHLFLGMKFYSPSPYISPKQQYIFISKPKTKTQAKLLSYFPSRSNWY